MPQLDWDAGSTQVTTAGTRVQISASSGRLVKAVSFQNFPGNAGRVVVGRSDVSMTDGWVLDLERDVYMSFGERQEGSNTANFVPWSTFWVDAANNNDRVGWLVIFYANA